MAPERFRYCLEQLKRYEHDRYLAVLLAPADKRHALAALYAFEAELARVPYTVSEPMLGEIRYQWWRDTLSALTPASRPGHEVAEALAETLFDTQLAPSDLVSLVDLYASQLTAEAVPTVDLWLADIEEVANASLAVRLLILGVDAHDHEALLNLEHAAQIVRKLKSLPFHSGAQRLVLPLDLMGMHDADPRDVFEGVARPGLKALLSDLLDIADRKYAQGAHVLRPSDGVLHALLPAALTPLYIKRMRARGFDPLRHACELPAFRRQLRLLRVMLAKRF